MTDGHNGKLAEQSLELVKLFTSIPCAQQRDHIVETVKAAAFPSNDPFAPPVDPLPLET